MAQDLAVLQAKLKALDGVADAYVQPPTSGMEYPCIMIERDLPSDNEHADNRLYQSLKGYTITVMDRDPYSAIPDLVEDLRYSQFDRKFKSDGLNHFVFQMFF